MSPANPAQPSPRPLSPNTEQSSAADREKKHVQSITEARDRDRDDDEADMKKAERASQHEHDSRVQTITNQAKEAGHEIEADKISNEDG